MKTGVYKHYKGGYYQVLGIAEHTETGERLVVYVALSGAHLPGPRMNVRPETMFNEPVSAQRIRGCSALRIRWRRGSEARRQGGAMTDRRQALTVYLDRDYRDDDLDDLVAAIRQLRGVAAVALGEPVGPADHFARERVKLELRAQLLELLAPHK